MEPGFSLLLSQRVGDACFPWLQCQAHAVEPLRDSLLTFVSPVAVWVDHDQISRVAQQRRTFSMAGERFVSALLQTVEGHMRQEWRGYTSYKVANFLVEYSTSIPRTQLRPSYGDGFLGAPLHTVLPREEPAPGEQGGRRGTSSTHPQHNPGGAHHV